MQVTASVEQLLAKLLLNVHVLIWVNFMVFALNLSRSNRTKDDTCYVEVTKIDLQEKYGKSESGRQGFVNFPFSPFQSISMYIFLGQEILAKTLLEPEGPTTPGQDRQNPRR